MKATRLDRRVRKEARLLIRAAHKLRKRPREAGGPTPAKTEQLDEAAAKLQSALDKREVGVIRALLPRLDALVDDLSAGHGKSTIREYVESIGVAIAIALVLRAFVVEAFKIPSSSMIPTMEIGDHIFVNKFIYGVRIPWTRTKLFEVRPPRRGEVIVFMNPCIPEKDYIKRIVAIEGDTVEMRCSVLYINGQPIKQELIQSDGCTYWDLLDESAETWLERSCSRYREHIGDADYEAYYKPERPQSDKHRARGLTPDGDRREDDPHGSGGDEHDFPDLLSTGDGLIPQCNTMREATHHPAPAGQIVRTTNPSMARTECAPHMHYVVPKGHVFCMGDNRDNSNDSRTWGPVPVENIKGKALFIWWSSSAKSDGPRFSRMGQIVH